MPPFHPRKYLSQTCTNNPKGIGIILRSRRHGSIRHEYLNNKNSKRIQTIIKEPSITQSAHESGRDKGSIQSWDLLVERRASKGKGGIPKKSPSKSHTSTHSGEGSNAAMYRWGWHIGNHGDQGWMYRFTVGFHHGIGSHVSKWVAGGERLQYGTQLPPIQACMDDMTTLTTTAPCIRRLLSKMSELEWSRMRVK